MAREINLFSESYTNESKASAYSVRAQYDSAAVADIICGAATVSALTPCLQVSGCVACPESTVTLPS